MIVAPVCREIRLINVLFTCWIKTTPAFNNSSCARLETDRPTIKMSGRSFKILPTKISMYFPSCSNNVCKDAIRFSVRVNSIPPLSSIIFGLLISFAMRLWLTVFRKRIPDKYYRIKMQTLAESLYETCSVIDNDTKKRQVRAFIQI